MSTSFPFRPGYAYRFSYPRHNYRGLPETREARRIRVESIRDLQQYPLEEFTTTQNPTLCRGRWLITGHDLDRDAQRSFYLESMADVSPLSYDELNPYRAATYVILTPTGRAAAHIPRLADALDGLMARSSGVLCRILSSIEEERDRLPAKDRAESTAVEGFKHV